VGALGYYILDLEHLIEHRLAKGLKELRIALLKP
jgi:hypothetical protein